jgi:hypothetical protein
LFKYISLGFANGGAVSTAKRVSGCLLTIKISIEVIAKLEKAVTLVPAFARINSSGGPEVLEKYGSPLPRRNDILGVLQLDQLTSLLFYRFFFWPVIN